MFFNRVNSYIKATVFYIIGNGIGQGLLLLSTIVFTRIMSRTDYGLYSTYYSTVSLFTTLVGANLYHAVNNAYIDYKNDIHEFRASNLFLSTLVFFSISMIFIVLNFFVGFPFFFVIAALLHSFSFFVITFYNNSANMENRFIAKSVLLILPNLFQIVLSIVFIMTLPISSLNARVIGSTLGVAVCSSFAYITMIKGHTKLINKEYWVYALKISVPSILTSISSMIMSQSDHIMITVFRNANETAVYSLVYYVGYIIFAIIQAVDGVVKMWIFNTLDRGNIKNVRLIQKWYLFSFSTIVVGILMVAPEIVKLLSPKSYWNFHYIGPFVIGSFIMSMYNLYGNEGLYYKKTGQLAICISIAAVVNLILNFFMINLLGGIGAAISTAISYFIVFLGEMFFEKKWFYNLFCKKYFFVSLAFVMVVSLIFELIYSNIVLRYSFYMVLLITALVYATINKKEWKSIAIKNGG